MLDIELKQIPWKEYLEIDNRARKVIGIPALYTINPDTGRCIIWPTPIDEITLIVRVNDVK